MEAAIKQSLPKGSPAAFFDVDGTLGSSNIVRAYLSHVLLGASGLRRFITVACFLPRVPYYILVDNINRDWFNVAFYRNYAGIEVKALERWCVEGADSYYGTRLFPKALETLAWHKGKGHRIVLVSGGIEPVLRPLAAMLDVDSLIAAEPEVLDGRLTGRLLQGSMGGRGKANAVNRLSQSMGIDLCESYAYGDSYWDKALLECVGHGVAVNPDRRLRRLARRKGWRIHNWGH